MRTLEGPKTYSSEVRRLEALEAEAWFAYRRASQEHQRARRMRLRGTKQWKKKALALNRRHGQIMHEIMLLHRQRIFGSARD